VASRVRTLSARGVHFDALVEQPRTQRAGLPALMLDQRRCPYHFGLISSWNGGYSRRDSNESQTQTQEADLGYACPSATACLRNATAFSPSPSAPAGGATHDQ
jgi:hypothetical protein